MKISIRKNVFETNSSSVHAISVTSKPARTEYLKYHSIEFNTGEFGWEHCTYYDATTKASYLWTAIVQHFIKEYVHGEIDKNFKVIKPSYIILDLENPEYIKRRDAIKNTLIDAGMDEENIKFEEDFNPEYGDPSDGGYIDHTPGLDFIDSLVFNPDRLLRYLFNDSSVITTWNDNEWYIENEDEFDNMLEERYYDPETGEYDPKYWELSEWAHFDIPEDTEWKYLKNN